MDITLNTILEELNDIPVDKLGELHSLINTLKAHTGKSEKKRKKIRFNRFYIFIGKLNFIKRLSLYFIK